MSFEMLYEKLYEKLYEISYEIILRDFMVIMPMKYEVQENMSNWLYERIIRLV